VPEVVANGEIDGHDVLLMTLAAGTTVAEALEHDPDHVTGIATGLGALLGAINWLPAPAGLAPADAWLDRAGPELAPLRARMQALPNADRLLHLDFHPQNVMVDGEEVTAVIDWTNTLPGPPHIDLGRSRAILHMVRTLPRLSPEIAALMERFETGLVAAHARHHGPDPDPDLTLAWGVGTQCVDFAPQVERPGSWVTAELVAALEAKRDALIAKVAGS
jgi:hypothetical protein